jgi:hypothetical protein
LCALTDTLIIDSDGVCDLGSFNDRLLLGLKGTMSEAELHLLAGRLQGAKLAAAQRGELRFPLPVGYIYDDDGRTVIDLDEEVRAAVADVFASFEAKGSAYAVVAAFAGRRFPTRAYGGVWAGDIRWGRLIHGRVLQLLSNPSYAGAYVFGRFRSRRAVDPDGTLRIKSAELPREPWQVLMRDHHPAYITWRPSWPIASGWPPIVPVRVRVQYAREARYCRASSYAAAAGALCPPCILAAKRPTTARAAAPITLRHPSVVQFWRR